MKPTNRLNGHANGHANGRVAALATDRQPPQNLEAEMGVLGSCLLDGRMIDEAIAAGLRADDFARAAHGEWWAAILAVQAAGDEVDAITVADYLERRGAFARLGGDESLRRFVESVPHAANAAYYAGIVRERAVGRRIIEACTAILRKCYSHEFTAPDLLCEAQELIGDVVDRDATGDTVSYAALVDETMARMAAREDSGLLGRPSGFEDLDALTGGFRDGELTILAARPAMGKSALSVDFAEAVARGDECTPGAPALFFSIEMGREQLGDRIVSGDAGIDGRRLQRPWALAEREREDIRRAALRLHGLPVEVDFSPTRSVADIGAVARRMKRRRGLGIVVVDYLQLIEGVRQKNDNREQEVARISRDLKALARSLSVPVLVLAQLNREVEKRADKTPVMSDLRESGSLEQDADVVLMLHRPDYYDRGATPGMAELIVAKNRNGATGIVPLVFEARFTRFTSAARANEVPDDRPY